MAFYLHNHIRLFISVLCLAVLFLSPVFESDFDHHESHTKSEVSVKNEKDHSEDKTPNQSHDDHLHFCCFTATSVNSFSLTVPYIVMAQTRMHSASVSVKSASFPSYRPPISKS
jgi:hypothetical protein